MQTEAEAAALSCPKTPRQIQSLMNGLQRLSTQISGASGGVVGSIAWDKYTPAACTQVRRLGRISWVSVCAVVGGGG
jgi:hypothetical protein